MISLKCYFVSLDNFLLLLVELFGCILWKQRNVAELAQFHNLESTEVGLFLGPDLRGTEVFLFPFSGILQES